MAVQPTRDDASNTGTLDQYAHLYDVDRLRQDIKTGENGTASDGGEFGAVKGSDSITVEDGVAKVNPGIFGDGVKVEDGQVTFDEEWFLNNFRIYKTLTTAENAKLYIGPNNQIRPLILSCYGKEYGTVMVSSDIHYLSFFASAFGNELGVNVEKLGEHFAGAALYYDSAQGLMVKVGQGLHIQNDEIDIDQDGLPLASAANRGTVKVGTGLAIDAEGVLSANLSGALKALNYTFTDKFTVNLSEGVSYTAITYGDIAHKYVAGAESYEVYKANFTFNVPQAYTAGTTIGFSFTFSYNGSNVTAPKRSMATVINKDTGAVVGNYLTACTTGAGAKYVLTVPVTETIPAQTILVVLMSLI